MPIQTPISVGELLDKITILQIKQQHIQDAEKLQHVAHELKQLQDVADTIPTSDALKKTMDALLTINQKLWNIEDDIRACERAKDFGERFIELARAVYFTNDERARLKREINALTQSDLVEVKSYEAY